jgi:UDP-N-acetylglucosamine--N-acetylmuramyl-(pentapeptide) pyrophosphoryl-undecaprenol N-acetylglucosamine transferase
VGQLKNVSLMTRLRTLADLPRSIFACKRLIREFKPSVVFGVGGYASGPAMAAALLAQGSRDGLRAQRHAGAGQPAGGQAGPGRGGQLSLGGPVVRNCEVTGIPVRPEFFDLEPPGGGPPHLLVFGGSQGARIFNSVLPTNLVALLDAVPGLTVLHQSGVRHAESTQAAYAASGADPSAGRCSPFWTICRPALPRRTW